MKIFEYQDPQNLYKFFAYRLDMNFQIAPEIFLSMRELELLEQLKNQKRQQQFLQSRFWLKSLLSETLNRKPAEIHFKVTGEGKPILDLVNDEENGGGLDFNISHSDNFFVIGLTDKGSIGLDIEKIRCPEHLEKVADRIFNSDEKTALLSALTSFDQEIIFTKLWSGKEALIKAAAGGIFKHAYDIVMTCSPWAIKKLPKTFGSLDHWQLQFHENIEGYIVSSAFRSHK